MVSFNTLKDNFDEPVKKGTPPSWFRATMNHNTEEAERFDQGEDYGLPFTSLPVNKEIVEAHNYIEGKNGFSPYETWANVRGFSDEDLPMLMNVDDDAKDYIVKHPEFSPPVENIEIFCRSVGVHPAYLMPCLMDDKLSYHANIFQYIVEIAKDESAPFLDRELAFKAMENERGKFEAFEKANAVEAGYLRNADAISFKAELPDTLKGLFAGASAGEISIDDKLDLFEARLKASFDKVDSLLNPHRERYQATGKGLLELAHVLYGDQNAHAGFKVMLGKLRKLQLEFDEEIDWGYEDDATLFFESQNWKINSPQLHPNFELHARQWMNLKPDDVIASFIDVAVSHVNRLSDFEAAKKKLEPKLHQVEWPLELFQKWRKSPESEKQIQLFLNFKIVESMLGEKESPVLIRNVPAVIDHRYDYIFPHLAK